MRALICTACGVLYPEASDPPQQCPICEDYRQPVPKEGQSWTTMAELAAGRHNEFRQQEPHLVGIGTAPTFAIGQRALLLQTAHGNVLWDCVTLLDDATAEAVRKLGGIRHIAVSHPHYYASMDLWAEEFDATIHLAAADREWVQRPGPRIDFWSGRRELVPGVTLVQAGGHFEGAAVLHWAEAAGGLGALLSGDVIAVLPGRDPRVSFMRSYPMLLPLPPEEVERVTGSVADLRYDRIYGAFWDRVIDSGGEEAVRRSAELYLSWVLPRPDSSGTASASSSLGTIE